MGLSGLKGYSAAGRQVASIMNEKFRQGMNNQLTNFFIDEEDTQPEAVTAE